MFDLPSNKKTKTIPIYSIYMYKADLTLNNLQCLICHKTKLNHIYIYIYIYKEISALNNLQWLICHKTQPNKIAYI